MKNLFHYALTALAVTLVVAGMPTLSAAFGGGLAQQMAAARARMAAIQAQEQQAVAIRAQQQAAAAAQATTAPTALPDLGLITGFKNNIYYVIDTSGNVSKPSIDTRFKLSRGVIRIDSTGFHNDLTNTDNVIVVVNLKDGTTMQINLPWPRNGSNFYYHDGNTGVQTSSAGNKSATAIIATDLASKIGSDVATLWLSLFN